MKPAAAQTTFTLRAAQETLGLSRTVLAGLIAAGFVTPSRGRRQEYRFTFQDLALLRTAHALQQAKVAPRKIIASLARLRQSLPAELPLTGLRITAVGAEVAVRGGGGTLESAASGQYLLDFELAAVAGSVAVLDRQAESSRARNLFERGEALEETDRPAAIDAYEQAIALDPADPDPYLNLGAILCEDGDFRAALRLLDAALLACPPTALLHYNRAVALEDLGHLVDAIAGYERSLKLDPALADAHFNIARLQEQLGDSVSALRHFSAYRRLQR